MEKGGLSYLKPFIAPGSTDVVTQEEIQQRVERVRRAEEIGQSITRVDTEDGYENPYSVKALYYIANDLEVPDELKRKIQEFEAQHEMKKQNMGRECIMLK